MIVTMHTTSRPRFSSRCRQVAAAGSVLGLSLLSLASGRAAIDAAGAPPEGGGPAAIKTYLVGKLQKMDAASHDFVNNAAAYQKIIDDAGEDYNRAVMEHGKELESLVVKMQGDYRIYHNNGYETVEGIVAGTKIMVDFDTYLDAGVPKADASTDSPYSPLVLKSRDGKIITDRNGNLFHYIIEPTLWGTKELFVRHLSPEAAATVAPINKLPRAEVLSSASADCARKLDELLGIATRWQPTMEECVGALVWMTPTLNGYFDDWRDSRYNPQSSLGRYVAESRVLDMRGIMSSLQIVCNAILPDLTKKDPALASRLKAEYADVMGFIAKVDDRESHSGGKMSAAQIEELAFQAKRLTDQLNPHLHQMAAVLNLRLPPKPTLA